MLALIESTARATIRHSDSEPIASAAATASVNADEAVGALWPLKPAAPDGRIMVWILSRCGRITCIIGRISQRSRATLGRLPLRKMAETRQSSALCPLFPGYFLAISLLFLWRLSPGGDACRILDV